MSAKSFEMVKVKFCNVQSAAAGDWMDVSNYIYGGRLPFSGVTIAKYCLLRCHNVKFCKNSSFLL